MSKPRIKDSGERQNFDTGSQRDTRDGKGRFDLVFFGWPRILFALARHMEEGYKKYGWYTENGERKAEPPWRNNWTKGQPLSRYLDSAIRHMNKWLAGEKDEPHFTAMLWNFLCLGETWCRIRDGLLPDELNDIGDANLTGYENWPT